MGSAERRERARLEVRKRILDAARQIFANEGPDNVTMRRVADAIEYTATTIYQHFADKDALLQALLTEDFQTFSAEFAIVLTISDPVERLDAMSRAYMRFAFTHPFHYRELFMVPVECSFMDPETTAANQNNPDRDAYAALAFVMQSVMDSGRTKPEHDNLHLNCQLAWSTLHGIASLAIAKRAMTQIIPWEPLDALFEQSNDMILQMLLRADDPFLTGPRVRPPIPPYPPAAAHSSKNLIAQRDGCGPPKGIAAPTKKSPPKSQKQRNS